MLLNYLYILLSYLLFERMVGLFLLKYNAFKKKKEFKVFMVTPFSLVISFIVLCWEYYKSLYNKLGD